MQVTSLQVSVRQAQDLEFEQLIDRVSIGPNREKDLTDLIPVFNERQSFQYPYSNGEYLNPAHCHKRAYLAVINVTMHRFNAFVLDEIPGESPTYYSTNVIKEQHDFEARNIPYDNFLKSIE